MVTIAVVRVRDVYVWRLFLFFVWAVGKLGLQLGILYLRVSCRE